MPSYAVYGPKQIVKYGVFVTFFNGQVKRKKTTKHQQQQKNQQTKWTSDVTEEIKKDILNTICAEMSPEVRINFLHLKLIC